MTSERAEGESKLLDIRFVRRINITQKERTRRSREQKIVEERRMHVRMRKRRNNLYVGQCEIKGY